MSTTVAAGSLTVTSTSESASDMVEALSPEKPESGAPRVLVDKGEPVEEEPESELSKAASELGKKGGEAAAKARKEALKAKPIKEKADGTEGARGERARSHADGDDEVHGDDSDERVDSRSDAEDATEAPPESKKGNPRHDPQARVAQATREAKEAREAAAAAAAEARAVKAELERIRSGAPPAEERKPPVQEDAEPQEGDFESYSDWVRAHAQWNRREWKREAQREAQAHAVASQQVKQVTDRIDGFQAAIGKAQEADPEFAERIKPAQEAIGLPSYLLPANTRPTGLNWIADQIVSAPGRAPALLLHLSEHPAEIQRLAALSSPREITWELAMMYSRLEAATAGTSTGREVSKAKPPVRPVTGSPHTADQEPDEDAPLSAFVQRFGQRELARSKR